MLILLLTACASHRSMAELEARVTELEAAREFDAARIASLETQVAEQSAALSAASAGADPGVVLPGSVGEGLRCELVEERLLLPAEAVEANALSRAVRVIPHRGSDGEVDGYRISAVRRGSLLDSCSFKNGDVLHRVNGTPLTTPDQALSAYSAAATASVLRFELTRRGAPVVVELHRRAEGAAP